MVDGREALSLSYETDPTRFIAGNLVRKNFDGDTTIEARVLRKVNRPHGAMPEAAENRVGPDSFRKRDGLTERVAGS